MVDSITDFQSISLGELGTTYSGLQGKTKEDFEMVITNLSIL